MAMKYPMLTNVYADLDTTPHQRMSSGMSLPHHDLEGRTDYTQKKAPVRKHPIGLEAAGGALPTSALKEMVAVPQLNNSFVNTLLLLLGIIIGAVIGGFLSELNVSSDVENWVALPGALYIDALKCLVTPLIFTSVVSSVGDLMATNKVTAVGLRTLGFFLLSGFLSSCVGTLMGAVFASSFKAQDVTPISNADAVLTFRCADNSYLIQHGNGTVVCDGSSESESMTRFTLVDSASVFTRSDASSLYDSLSFYDQVLAILEEAVPTNIVTAFADGTNLSVVMFSIFFGAAVYKTFEHRPGEENYVVLLLGQATVIMQMLLNSIIKYMPIAAISMVAGDMASSDTVVNVAHNVITVILALIAGLFIVVFVIMGPMFYFITRRNFFSFLGHLVPAQLFTLGCASPSATLPATVRCMDATGEVTKPLTRFVLTVGATFNLSGTAVYVPLMCIFMAKLSGQDHLLTGGNYVLLAFVGTLASFGASPVSHAVLVMVITVWKIVFSSTLPDSFALVVGLNWLLDRLRCVVNITNNAIIARIVAELTQETTHAHHNMAPFVFDSDMMTPQSDRAQMRHLE